MNRDPKFLSARPASDLEYGRTVRHLGMVDVPIVYEGMKSQPVDIVRMTSAKAVELATALLLAATNSGFEGPA